MFEKLLVTSIFMLTYFLIIFGRLHRSVVVFTMGMIVAATKVVESMKFHNIGSFIDFNTIGLLLGMMIIVGLLKRTGFFQYIAIKVVRSSKTRIWQLIVSLTFVIAVLSAFLDNVTTILLMSPIMLLIADTIKLNPVPLIFMSVLASNIGGTATVIGDPPNILVGSASGISFVKFARYMAPPSFLVFGMLLLYFKPLLKLTPEMDKNLSSLTLMDPVKAISDKKLLRRVLGIFAAVMVFFLFHEILDYEIATIALVGAAFAILISGENFESISKSVEWDTLFFFMGLFMLAFALQEVGVIDLIADALLPLKGHPVALKLGILWLSGLVSAFIGAVPTVTVMVPIVKTLAGGEEIAWIALALGASLGGLGTITGTAANIVGIGILENHTASKVGYLEFMKISFPFMLMALGLCSLYLLMV